MKTFQNNFTTPEQSKRLLELEVPADSADCAYIKHVTNRDYDLEILKERSYSEEVCEFEGFYDYLPCWSAGRLIEIYEICTRKVFERNDVYSPLADIYTTIECKSLNKRIDFSKLEE